MTTKTSFILSLRATGPTRIPLRLHMTFSSSTTQRMGVEWSKCYSVRSSRWFSQFCFSTKCPWSHVSYLLPSLAALGNRAGKSELVEALTATKLNQQFAKMNKRLWPATSPLTGVTSRMTSRTMHCWIYKWSFWNVCCFLFKAQRPCTFERVQKQAK